jgi:hypothetical protein
MKPAIDYGRAAATGEKLLRNSQTFADLRKTESGPQSEQRRRSSQNSQVSQGGGGGNPSQRLDRDAALTRARELLAPSIREHEAPAYPIDALGPLAPACRAIAVHGQVQPAMVGQCLLGAAALLTQGLFNVETLAGVKPLSLYLLTLGDSGDGKSTAEDAALAPLWAWQREANAAYGAELERVQAERARRKKGDPAPEEPRPPHRLCMDATVEGLRRDLSIGAASQAIFTSEAASMLAGYGMSAEHRSKTAGVFNALWDRGLLSVSRVTGGRTERHGCRIAMHWLVQPVAAAEVLNDSTLSKIGFWPRFLIAWPSPATPRRASPLRWAEVADVGRYWQRCTELLAEPLPDDATVCPVLTLDRDALALASAAFERFEHGAKARGGSLRAVRPFALRATEQACRVAGVMAAFAGRHSISAADMRGALELVSHSLETWGAIVERGDADHTGPDALRLLEWLTTRTEWRAPLGDMLRLSPIRSKDRRDAALSLLSEHGLAAVIGREALALMPGDTP